jgi:hypothetical protein
MESQRTHEPLWGTSDRPKRRGKSRKMDTHLLSRRDFLTWTGQLAAALAFVPASGILSERGWLSLAYAAEPDLVHDTVNGLIAFIVPGPDDYSVAQGVSTPEPGGIDAGIIEVLIEGADKSQPSPPPASAVIATILNDVAQQVNPSPSGPFLSPFANLSFAEKVTVFAVMESYDPLKQLAGVLPFFVAFLAYSEAGVFDPVTRTPTGQPVGWTLSGYEGVADGRDEFIGYFENRKKVKR